MQLFVLQKYGRTYYVFQISEEYPFWASATVNLLLFIYMITELKIYNLFFLLICLWYLLMPWFLGLSNALLITNNWIVMIELF